MNFRFTNGIDVKMRILKSTAKPAGNKRRDKFMKKLLTLAIAIVFDKFGLF